jgi:hypothetical protein
MTRLKRRREHIPVVGMAGKFQLIALDFRTLLEQHRGN